MSHYYLTRALLNYSSYYTLQTHTLSNRGHTILEHNYKDNQMNCSKSTELSQLSWQLVIIVEICQHKEKINVYCCITDRFLGFPLQCPACLGFPLQCPACLQSSAHPLYLAINTSMLRRMPTPDTFRNGK